MKNLQQALLAKKEELEGLLPESFQASFQQLIHDLKEEKVRQNVLDVGNWAPDFALQTPTGQLIERKSLLGEGPLVVTFYLGSWSPYCVLQLKALQKQLYQMRGLGGQLVAISPESPERGLATSRVHQLQYPLLHDWKGRVAESFGLLFTVPEYLRAVYDRLGVDLPTHNRDERFVLPLPTTIVIDRQGRITYAYTAEDFSQRAPIRDLLSALYRIRSQSNSFAVSRSAGQVSPSEEPVLQ